MEPFEIAPAGDLLARMLAEMPEGTQPARVVAGTLAADGSGWVALDPAYFRPDQEVGAIGVTVDATSDVQVVLDLLTVPESGGRAVVAALSALTGSDADVTETRELEDSVAVDFPAVIVARADAMRRCWRVGGPGCSANLLHATDTFAERESTRAQIAEAVAALEAAGVEVVERRGRPHLGGVVTDAVIARAEEVLGDVASEVRLNVGQSSTGAGIGDALADAPFAVWRTTTAGRGPSWLTRASATASTTGTSCARATGPSAGAINFLG